MKLVFDPSYPDEQLTAEFWREQLEDAAAEWLLKEMEKGRIPPPGLWEE